MTFAYEFVDAIRYFPKTKDVFSLYLTLRASIREATHSSQLAADTGGSHFSLTTDKTDDVTRSQLLNMLSVLDITKFLEKAFYLNSNRKAKEKIKEVGGVCVLLA